MWTYWFLFLAKGSRKRTECPFLSHSSSKMRIKAGCNHRSSVLYSVVFFSFARSKVDLRLSGGKVRTFSKCKTVAEATHKRFPNFSISGSHPAKLHTASKSIRVALSWWYLACWISKVTVHRICGAKAANTIVLWLRQLQEEKVSIAKQYLTPLRWSIYILILQ